MSIAWTGRLRPCAAAHSPRGAAASRRLLPLLLAGAPRRPAFGPGASRRALLTLAIESSCDDTCVAILDKAPATGAARLLFNRKITSDNRDFRGVHPLNAVLSHTTALAPLLREALASLPEATPAGGPDDDTRRRQLWAAGALRRKPDFVTVTRGPGMTSNLATGLNTAKGLAAAWDVPLVGVNHMQAHALTPRLVAALDRGVATPAPSDASGASTTAATTADATAHAAAHEPAFPFLSLLVSGGHTLLVLSRSLYDHEILAQAMNIAIGDMIDKCARNIIPASELADMDNVMYGPLFEKFAFPSAEKPEDYDYTPPARRADEIKIFDSGLGWTLTPLLASTSTMAYDFAGFHSQVLRVAEARPDMSVEERRFLAQHVMRLAFEHLASRLLLALKNNPEAVEGVRAVVVAGGVASNRYLMHILRSMLAVRGYEHLTINSPPPALCTDNAAMIAWTGMEMYEAGYSSNMDILPIRKWPVDPRAEGGGIMGADGWVRNTDDR